MIFLIFNAFFSILSLILILIVLFRFRASPVYFSWRNLQGSFKRIFQNAIRGWNDSDTWSLDITVSKFILPRLKKFRENLHSYPSILIPEGKDLEETQKNMEESNFQEGCKKWKEIVDKMIFSFECIKNGYDDIEMPDPKFKLVKYPDEKFSCLEYDLTPEEKIVYDKEYAVYKSKLDEREKQVSEGLQLFAKYFSCLWD